MTTDITKAFDSIDWKRIEENMELLKFPKDFTEIIMEMLNNAKTKIEIQNTLSESFKINRGTRQGDPVSPALYNIFIEPMLRWLDMGDTKGYQIEKINIKIGEVADDMVIFGKSNQELQRILNKIETYLNSANVYLNPKKCDYISNIKDDKNKHIVSKSGIEIKNKENEPIRYLGIWLTINLKFGHHWKNIQML
jgi:retron-type reverse transcriptase